MLQNTLMVAGLRSVAAARSSSGTAGGVIRAGAGAAYAAGQLVGTLGRVGTAGGRAATSAAGQGLGHVRMAAYKLAALRGRT